MRKPLSFGKTMNDLRVNNWIRGGVIKVGLRVSHELETALEKR